MDLAELQAENDELIAHRAGVGLSLGLAGTVALAIGEWLQPGPRPAYVMWTYLVVIPFALAATLLFRAPAVRRAPVPYVLGLFVLSCVLRLIFGTWRGDPTSTVFMGITLSLAAGGALPWGVRAQAAAAACCGATIAIHYALATGAIGVGARQAIAVAGALLLSVVLAYDRERHRRRVFDETLARHRSERALAQLNAALEERVRERAAEIVTVRRGAEEQARRHQAELAHVQRVATMGEITAGLAHEINQPIGAIANYALGAARRLRDGTAAAADLRPIVEAIGAEALRAGDIIRRIRELLRKEAPGFETVDLNEVARAAVRVSEAEAQRLGVRLATELAPALPAVHGTAIQLEQVLLNLLLNAIEASAEGPDAGAVVLRTAAAGGGVELTISDAGSGLPAPPADVFAPFFTTKTHGLGMGLAISRSIVEGHGGTIEGWTRVPRGATFRVRLPAGAAPAAQGSTP